jgi:uncharacterized protein (UPF0548 family)
MHIFSLRVPDDAYIQRRLSELKHKPYNYSCQGATWQPDPAPGWQVSHFRAKLGHGPERFAMAQQAVLNWQMFQMDWVRLCFPQAPVEVGTLVAVQAWHLGFLSLNFARILYVIEEKHRFGFAYGTVGEHAMRGEERFVVECQPADGTVHYDLYAISKPNHWLTSLAQPLMKRYQKRFARESLRAMQRAVRGTASRPKVQAAGA